MANNEIGGFLNITPDVLNKLDSFDKKLEQIEKHSKTAADALKSGFSSVNQSTSTLSLTIGALAKQIEKLNTAGVAVKNVGTAMGDVSRDATKAANSISSAAKMLNIVKPDNSLVKSVEQYRSISAQIEQVSGRQKQLNDIIKSYELTMSRINSGKGGRVSVAQQQQAQAARQELDTNNQLLSSLRQKQQEIVNTNRAYQQQIQLTQQLRVAEQERNSLPNQRSQKTLADMRAYYTELEKSSARAAKAAEAARAREEKASERAASKAEKDAERKAKADERAAQRAAKAAEALARQQEIAKRTTPQGALDYSKNAKSLRDQANAINYLKQARLSLNTTDANYKNTLTSINNAIAQHNRALQQAGVQSQSLARNHRNLMDTAGQLSRQLALLFSVSQIEGYISKLTKVRGEFELQQRSLQAILQNKSQADQIFNKTVQLAVKSPFKIKELVSYTKQLAAYRIESDKLYDTTKMLADVSAGLGVDMGRLILAYGQVKAAAYLRGTEVRQFTEAGINLYGELQRYFEEVKGEAYTTAQIVDMISKRKVTFEDIENIFKRLTDSGGLFYNMQEIQSETLIGKMRNLQDSIDVMLNSIGKANEGVLKSSIDVAKTIIDNWETIAEVAKIAAGMFVLYKANSLLAASALGKVISQVHTFQKSIDASRAQAFFAEIGAGFRFTLESLKSIGKLIASNAYLIALTAIIYAVDKLTSSYSEYNRALEESNKKYNENMAPVNSLIAKYRELTDEANKARIAQEKNFDKPKNRKDRENIVSQLAGKFKEYGLNENIGDVSKLTDEELEDTLDRLNKKYREIQNTILAFSNSYTEVNSRLKNNWFDWSEGIETDAKDFKKAGDEILSYSSRITQMLDVVGSHYFDLSSKLAGYYNAVKKGPDTSKGESEVEWLLRALDALRKINSESKTIRTEFSNNKLYLFDIISSKGKFDSQKKEFENEVDRLKIELENKSIKDPVLISIALNQKAIDEEWTDLEKNVARKRLGGKYLSPIKSEDGKTDAETDIKLQRDILAERISLIKELNKEYEKLNKVMGSDKAAKTVMERYADSLKNVNIPKNIIGENFLPDKQSTAKALQEISKVINDFRKKQGVLNDSYQLLDSEDVDNIKKQLDKIKQNIEDMFNGLDLHQKLKDAGLSEAEVQALFPGLAKTLDEVSKGMEAEYQKRFPRGEHLIADTDANKQYKADQEKLNQQRIKEQQDLIVELTKAYKTQLSDQLQLDMWYYKERSKIYTKVYDEQTKTFRNLLTKEMQEQYSKNLKAQYDKKSSENTWKAFKGTDTYLNMFDNLENVSTKAIENMKAKLETLKEQLKDLDPSQLKEVMNFYNKMDEQLSKRNPLESFFKSYEKIKELKSQGITEDKLIETIAGNDVENASLQKQIENLNIVIGLKEGSIQKDSVEASFLENNIKLYSQSVDELKKQVEAKQKTITGNSKENENANKNLKYFKDARRSLEDMKSAWDLVRNAGQQAMGSIVSILETMGEDADSAGMRFLNMVGTIGDLVVQAVMFQLQLELCAAAATAMGIAMKSAMGPIGWVLIALQAVASILSSIFGNHDKDLQKEIEEHERKIKKLEREYNKLKETIDNVWDITRLQQYGNELNENINKQIVSLNAMIAAERDKKDTDWTKIDEWQAQIEDLRDTLKDGASSMIETLGGVGSDENFKTLADNFASAWLDAFMETGDGLSGLQEKFDEFMENYVKQQILLRLSEKFLKPMFDEFDSLIATRTDMSQNDQERYFELQAQITKLRNTANNSIIKSFAKKTNAAADEIENSEEYKRLQKAYTDFLKPNDINTEAIKDWSDRMQEVFGEYSDAAEEIFNQIGWEPSGTAELSALTQSIQGLTENTAEELAALLESIRFFVASQTSDITAIRNLIERQYELSDSGSSNPMLIELKSQTEYLKLMSDNFESILSYSGNSKGRGIRVFMQ